MLMAVVGVRKMGMCVAQRLVSVHMAVALTGSYRRGMFVNMVRVVAMHMFVLVCRHCVVMFMHVALA